MACPNQYFREVETPTNPSHGEDTQRFLIAAKLKKGTASPYNTPIDLYSLSGELRWKSL